MSQDQENAPKVNAKALLAEIEKNVAQKKAQGFYDPAEISRVEQAAVCFAQPAEDGAEAELSLRHAKLQGLWDTKACGVSSHRGGAAGSAVIKAKQLIHKLTRFLSNIWLARQVEFNDELVKLLNVLAPHHADLRQRMPLAEKRLDDLEDLSRDFSSLITEHGQSLRQAEARLAALEREAGKGAAQVEALLARLQGILDEQVASGAVSAGTAQAVAAERQRQRGSAYLAFEDIHRGSRAEIKERQRVYVPIFEKAVGPDRPLLDIGCGRGEFLELAKEAGLAAKGVDINPEMAAHCRELGLEAEEGDALEYLRGLPDQSLGGIMASQIIEHLTVDQLTELVSLCAAKLAPGGVLAAETVNPQCLTTFSGAFYLDITHQKPIHPEAARFLWRWAGLADIEILYLSPYPPDHRLEIFGGANGELAESYNRNMDRLNQLLYSHQDYAVVGRK